MQQRPCSRRFPRSEEHTSELQSLRHLVCRLLLEKKNQLADPEPGRGQLRNLAVLPHRHPGQPRVEQYQARQPPPPWPLPPFFFLMIRRPPKPTPFPYTPPFR